jgi:hypothetical protein
MSSLTAPHHVSLLLRMWLTSSDVANFRSGIGWHPSWAWVIFIENSAVLRWNCGWPPLTRTSPAENPADIPIGYDWPLQRTQLTLLQGQDWPPRNCRRSTDGASTLPILSAQRFIMKTTYLPIFRPGHNPTVGLKEHIQGLISNKLVSSLRIFAVYLLLRQYVHV